MAKKIDDDDKPKTKRRKKSCKDTIAHPALLDIALVEFVRLDYNSSQAERLTGVGHSLILREWQRLSDEEKKNYVERANSISDVVTQKLTDTHLTLVEEVCTKLKGIYDLALDEIHERLNDPFKRSEIKDADLLNIATKFIGIVQTQTTPKVEEKNVNTQVIIEQFNLLDNSIQEHLTKKSMTYEDK
jgi:hypothetical protein